MGAASDEIQMGENRNGRRHRKASTLGRKRSMRMLPTKNRLPATPMSTRFCTTTLSSDRGFAAPYFACHILRAGQTSHDPKPSSGNLRVRWPGDLLVVPLASDQTAMEDGNETVGEGAERLVMRLAFSPLAVVEAARTRSAISGHSPRCARQPEPCACCVPFARAPRSVCPKRA